MFETFFVTGTVESDELTEASGLVASKDYPGLLWSINDKGDGDARVIGIFEDGSEAGKAIK